LAGGELGVATVHGMQRSCKFRTQKKENIREKNKSWDAKALGRRG